jgi:methyl-accepting chemotaxis protein
MDAGLPKLRRDGDAYMLAVAALYATVAVGIGAYFNQVSTALTAGGVLLAAALGLFVMARGSWLNSVALPVILMSLVALHIHLGMGRAEFHFGVFLTIGFLLVYRHWLPLLAGAAALAVHHVLFDRLQAAGFPVFCLAEPNFADVVVHAGYLVAQTGFSIVMAIQLRRDALLMVELDSLTTGLSGANGKIDFSVLSVPVLTNSARKLQAALSSVSTAIRTVKASVESMTVTSAEIASGSQDLSARTEQSASSLQETASAMEELTGTVTQSAATATQAAKLSAKAVENATTASAAATRLDTSMVSITESSKKIADITGVIDGIAFQTNILALNAAIEAARAGEAGRGFAVVASEVRSLAKRSADAAKEIKDLIDQSTSQVEQGVVVSNETRAALSSILADSKDANDLMAELASAASEQRDGIAQVNQAVSNLDHATQQNAALVEQSAAAAVSFKDQAESLSGAMSVFSGDTVA